MSFVLQKKKDFHLYFRPVLEYGYWSIECFATKNVSNTNFILQKVICSHVFSEECITDLIKESFLKKDHMKCPYCQKILLNMNKINS